MSIRAFVLSDLHLGDPEGMLPVVDGGDGIRSVRPEFLRFLEKVERMPAQERKPLLVLAGDVWDIARCNLEDVADLSLSVFTELAPRLAVFESILFLPGNHDHALWTLLQTQTCILRPLEARRNPSTASESRVRPLPRSQCALLDFRAEADPELRIPGVTPPYVGNIFLTGLAGGAIAVNVAYPNLVVRRPDGSVLLVTHGHFFQQTWTILSDLLAPVVGDALPSGRNLSNLETLDASLTDFLNFSLAQVGPLNATFQAVFDDCRAGREPPQIRPVLAALRRVLDEAIPFERSESLVARACETVSDGLLDASLFGLRHLLRWKIAQAKPASQDPGGRPAHGFLADPAHHPRIEAYLQATTSDREIPVEEVDEVVFGHTHQSLVGEPMRLREDGPGIRFWNPGSLLARSGEAPDFRPLAIDHAGRVHLF